MENDRDSSRARAVVALALLSFALLLILSMMISWGPVGAELLLAIPLGVASALLGVMAVRQRAAVEHSIEALAQRTETLFAAPAAVAGSIVASLLALFQIPRHRS